MPHFTIEYSANLDGRTDIGGLCDEVLRAAIATGVFEIGGVRVRGVRCEHYAIADEHDDNVFIHIGGRIAAGRSLEMRKAAGAAIFAAAEAYLAPLFETPHFALSLEIREMDTEMNWKHNTMHTRLRGK